ncbi:MAG TPA: saccharopine dehydrogenase NADP-binding domain-containing protein [Ideonella sp.]|uniref:homospermidine synthase n=1 Tax=Ideonella sp. TaxID=1929293 RepID=UPI002E343B95|nr:saccharopine dehydrogenase NADP-binding domain-containing protein [Ideonella sp.]HEX5685043.1 saccharopine dehydrogenase NADP-binding domain-containing protein [Ideonella sp.]
MDRAPIHHRFGRRILMIGFGCIGQGVLPLLLRHIEMRPEQVRVLSRRGDPQGMAHAQGVRCDQVELRPDNLRSELLPRLAPGDLVLNLSVNVSSTALIALCAEVGALYLDTCIEPWDGGYTDSRLSAAQRSNYALREEALALHGCKPGPTALLTHGANPGLVSYFVKQALLHIARDTATPAGPPVGREAWAGLAQRLGVRVIHIAERDWQHRAAGHPARHPGEFVNTWSVEGFVDEACHQPAELGWGTHERHLPADAHHHDAGCRASVYLSRPGAATRVRSWTPLAGPQHAFLVTHAEAISIADHLTLGDPLRPSFRPTVHYAYRPCDDAVLSLQEVAAREWRFPAEGRVLKDDIDGSGIDELGVLLMGHAKGAYWYGSRLSTAQARQLCPHNSATSLQVTAAVMAGAVWVMRHPQLGIVEPDDLPHDEMLDLARPYLGDMLGVYTDWTPIVDRPWLFDEDIDREDPWQFKNFRVT